MRRILLVVLILFGLSVPAGAVFGAEYFLFDKENNQILFMGAGDHQFTAKIDTEKNPDRIIPTGDPHQYLAVFTPEIKKRKAKDAQKGQLLLFNIETGKSEDLVELGYGPFHWVYTKDRRHFFISYRPALNSDFELLHYNIPARKVETLPDFAGKLNYLVLSSDESKVYALTPGEDNKTPGKVLVLNYDPLTVAATIDTDLNPHSLFVLSPQKLALIDADIENRKKTGAIKIINVSDYSVIEEYKFDAPYHLYNYWYEGDHTLITMINAAKYKSFACKITSDGIKNVDVPEKWYEQKYIKAKDSLYLLTNIDFRVIDFKQNQQIIFNTDTNVFGSTSYHIFEIPGYNIVVLYRPGGKNVKFIDTTRDQSVKIVGFGRPDAKFANFMGSLIFTAAFASFSGFYNINPINLFIGGSAVAADISKSKYYIMGANTMDITVFDKDYQKLTYIVPKESLLNMLQTQKTNQHILVVTDKKIYAINTEDDSLMEFHEFKQPVKYCFCFEEENRLIILTDRDLLVVDPASLEVKNDFLLFGEPNQQYTRLIEGEQRYYFIPAL